MKYGKHFALFIIVLSIEQAFSQTPLWQWAVQAASTGNEQANDIAADASDNSFICGSFDGDLSATYGAAFSAPVQKDAFFAKYSPTGTFQSATKIGGSGNDEAKGIAINSTGDLYITGYFEGTCDFDPTASTFTLASAGGKDGFLAKYSSAGSLIWAIKFGGTGDEEGQKVVVSGTDVHLTGSATSGAVFYSTNTVTAAPTATQANTNFFGAKYNSSGVVQWLVSGGSSIDDAGLDLAADQNNVYYIGNYANTFTVYNASGTNSATLTSQGVNKLNVFVLAISQAGSLVWATNAGSSDNDNGNSITQDSLRLYITGDYNIATINFPYPSPTFTLSNGGLTDIYLACLNKSNGVYQWVSTETGSGSNEEKGYVVQRMTDGNLALAGVYKSVLNYTASGYSLTATGNDDIFIAAYTNTGTLIWATTAGGATVDHPGGIASATTGALFVAGDHANAATFGATTLPSAAGQNIFVAKTGCETVGNNTISASQQICTGSAPMQLNGTVPVATGTIGYNWQQQTAGNWTAAAGTNSTQNYSPPTLTTTTLYRRVVRSSGTCTFASTPLTVTVNQPPGPVSAGADQTLCTTGTTLSATALTVGTGTWTVLGGGATITSPNSNSTSVTNLSGGINSFVWSASNGGCAGASGTVSVFRELPPGPALAGSDQTICVAIGTMAATTPTTGTGSWSLMSGTGAIISVNSPTSVINSIGTGTNVFLWTVTNGICPVATSTIQILRDVPPSTAVSGPSQTLCAGTATLGATAPSVGTGTWTLLSGAGTLSSPSNPTSAITSLGSGINTLQWSVGNGVCPVSTASMSIQRDLQPGPAIAGTNQTICATSFSLAASSPTTGTGTWSLSTGNASIVSPGSQTTVINSIGTGTNEFVWSVTNGSCPTATSSVLVIRDDFPSTAAAGPSQTLCISSSALDATPPAVGSGTWSVISGAASISASTNPTSAVTGITNGITILQWSTGNGVCPVSTATMSIQRDLQPGPAIAGTNQTICATSFSLAASSPTTGTGTWSLSTGNASIVSPGSQTTVINSIGTGTNEFVWSVTNGSCPTATSSVQIIRDDFPSTAVAGPSQTLCISSSTLDATPPAVGTGTWSVISGAASISAPANPTSTLTGIANGITTLQWSTGNGVCPVSTATMSIQRDLQPGPSIAGTNQTICATSFSLSASSPTTGTGTWSLSTGTASIVSPGNPTTVINSIGTGTNEFVWSVNNGSCPTATSSVFIIRDDFPSTASVAASQTVCSTSATINAQPPAVGSGSWSVLSGTSSVSSPLNPTSAVTALQPGSNSFVWSITNGVCPASTATADVFQQLSPGTANAGSDQTVCATSFTLSANQPTAGSGMWTVITGTATLSSPTSYSSPVSGLVPGANDFVWTLSNGVCPASSSTVTITRDDFPSAPSAGTTIIVCSPTATLNGNTPSIGTGTWSLLSGSATILSPGTASSALSALGIGTNVLQWSIGNGVCPPVSSTMIVQQDEMPTPANAGSDQQLCTFTAQLSGNLPLVGTGQWTLESGIGTLAQPANPASTLTGLGTGSNKFVWVTSNGVCPFSFDTVTITRDDFPGPALAGSDQTLCASQATISATSPSAGLGSWSAPGPAVITNTAALQSEVTQLTTGTNLFIWTVINGVCPPEKDTVIVNVDPPPFPVAAGADQQVCADQATLAAANLFTGTGTWLVISGQATFSNPSQSNALVTSLQTGTTILVWTASNGSCVDVSDTMIIRRDEAPSQPVISSPTAVCGQSVNLSATAPSQGIVKWHQASGTGLMTMDSSPDLTVTALSQGKSLFIYSVTVGVCPSVSDSAEVEVWWEPGPANAGTDELICAAFTDLSAASPTAGNGSWTTLSGGATVDSPQGLTTMVSHLSKGDNIFRFTIQNGVCPSVFDDVKVTRDSIVLSAQAGTDIETENGLANLEASAPELGQGHWELVSGSGNLQDAAEYATTVTGLSTGNNVFRWVVTLEGCSQASDEVTVQYREFQVPNAITPNGDGKNDVFHITSLQTYASAKFTVFDRWGGTVYQNADYRNNWSGTNQSGRQLPDDTYFYSLDIPGKGNYTGFVDIKTK